MGRRNAILLSAALLGVTSKAHGISPRSPACERGVSRTGLVANDQRSPGAWPRPLDRIVSLDLGTVTLGRALDQIEASTGVHLAYSPDLLPLSAQVCLSVERRPLGGILMSLLDGSGVAPVVTGANEVVLAPSRSAVGSDATPAVARGTGRLARVVITGTATGAPERSSPFAIATIERAVLSASPNGSLASLMEGAVPGVWMWAQSPVSALARYGSIRGASSFGVSTPKMYIDGIEVANPLLLTTLDPAQVDRIEVIRGPQGAALYGSDAISGVVNIITRHDGVDGDAPTGEVHASAGPSASAYTDRGVAAQDYGANVRAGSAGRSGSLGFTLATLGAYVPGASATQALASASLRHVGSRVIVTGTARFEGTNAFSPVSPILRSYMSAPQRNGDSTAQRVRQYTVGGSATIQSSEQWTHALTMGVDGYRLSGVSGEPTPLPSLTDSALRAASGRADRLTLRYSSTRQLGSAELEGTSVTFGVEHSTARELTNGFGADLAQRPNGQGPSDSEEIARGEIRAPVDDPSRATSWWNNTGAFTQAQVTLSQAVLITGGVRVEHISGPSETGRVAMLPMVATSWVRDAGPITTKLRAAFGRGIRPARTVARGASFTGGHDSQTLTSLEPEEQSGVEAGIDAFWGNTLGVHVTRFDQRASGLVQPVAILSIIRGPSNNPPGSPEHGRVLYQLQNIGAIDNSGWELQGTSAWGALSLTGTMTFVSSRVARLASGYAGDLREGDRMLEVPARTMGLQARWATPRWSVSGTVAHAADWVNYDGVSLARTIAADPSGRLSPVGPALRAFWRTYDGATHLSATTSYLVGARTSLTLSGANLLNQQTGEPDNVTVVPGRTITLGLRSTY